jgi:hypothetical protein
MYTEICAELGEAIATASSTPGIQFHLILSLLQLPCSTEPQRAVNKMCPSADTQKYVDLGHGRLLAWMRGARGSSASWLRIWPAFTYERADDFFRTPLGSPRTDKLIAASIQWAKKIMENYF